MKNSTLYPLMFEPIFKEKIWGGNRLNKQLNKNCDPDKNIGESWEISGVDGNVSQVINGPLAGASLNKLCSMFGKDLLGEHVHKRFKNSFPILIKFLDASEDLSVQVHPNDEIAFQKHNSFGKSEMWYILNAEKESKIIYGFDTSLNEEKIKILIKNGEYHSHLNKIRVKPGESFFIEPGTVHAIGKGILLAEIQQTSDITYRLYDYDRVSADGSKRKLHITESLNVLKQNTIKRNSITDKNKTLFHTPHFTTNKLVLECDTIYNTNHKKSFIIYIVISGTLLITNSKMERIVLEKGQVVLIPYIDNTSTFRCLEKSTLLEVSISPT